MKPVKNKKHQPRYHPIDLYKVDIKVYCDVGGGELPYTIIKRLPITCVKCVNLTKLGADIDLGTIKVEPKYFKQIRKRKW